VKYIPASDASLIGLIAQRQVPSAARTRVRQNVVDKEAQTIADAVIGTSGKAHKKDATETAAAVRRWADTDKLIKPKE